MARKDYYIAYIISNVRNYKGIGDYRIIVTEIRYELRYNMKGSVCKNNDIFLGKEAKYGKTLLITSNVLE